MIIKIVKMLFLATAIGMGVLIVLLFWENDEASKQALIIKEPARLLRCNFYNSKDFMNSIQEAKKYEFGEKLILGGITPHHLLAGKLIASFFKGVAKSKPELVVMIAPNHKGVGVKNIQTGGWGWNTPFGVLQGDSESAKILLRSKLAGSNFNLLQEDHSIAGLIPYIKYYMPDARVLPILLHGSLDIDSAQRLGKDLKEMFEGERVVFIASVDFSHYLTMEEADKKDAETLDTLKSGNLQRLSMYGNDHLDSPQSIITLLSAIGSKGESKLEILEHSNADRITELKSDNTTSYFTIIYLK